MNTHLIKTGTNQVVRTFDSRKTAERFARLYNDLCGQQAAFSTRTAARKSSQAGA